MESLRDALYVEAAGVPPLGDIDRAINQVSISRRRWAGVIGVAGAVLVLLAALVGPGWQPLAVEPAAPEPGPTATSSVMPDPTQPDPGVQLPIVDPVPVTPRSNGDLAYVVDGSIVRRAPDGTATTWVPRSVLDDACGRPDCAIQDLEWSPNGAQLAVVLGTVRRLSPSQFGVYVIGDDSASPRKLFECPPAMCATLQGLGISWSPDSSELAVAAEYLGYGLVVVDANGPVADPRTLCDDCPAAAPAWSPDGRWIAYISSGTARRISAEGGPSELVAEGSADTIAWSPDGTRLLIGDEDGVHILDLSRRPYSARTIGEPLPPAEAGAAPAWSPDGERVSWFQTPQLSEGFRAEVWTASSDGSDPKRLNMSDCCVGDWSPPAWSPDGAYIMLGLGLDSTEPPDLIILESGDGAEVERTPGVGWGPMSWQALP